MANCTECGTEITSESSRFCSACGKPVTRDSDFFAETIASPISPRPSSTAGVRSTAAGTECVPGTVLLDRYRIIALLGRGGMGEVYRADDLLLGQQVALKFLPSELAQNPDAISRFRNEVRIARQVSHPNVCRVYDFGEVNGRLFLSMEYIDGEDLASLLRRIGQLPMAKALEIARKLCAGLGAAHEKGVLHRDLKPSNIMLDARGQILLTDFGLAGIADQIEGAEVRSGTPAYMAPEQLAGREVTIRSDIYSLGLVLYEIFTGKRPFEGNSIRDLSRARTETTPTSLTTLVRDVDPVVERVVLRCLDPDPSRRPASALAVSAGLPGGNPLAEALAAGETPSPEMVAAAGERVGVKPRMAVLLLAIVVAGLAATLYLANRSSMLNRVAPPYSPDILAQKARDLLQKMGYATAGADHASGFTWNQDYVHAVEKEKNPRADWNEVLKQRPSPMIFWYRQSPEPMIGQDFHDDLLTPGIVNDNESPPPTISGMAYVELEPDGKLRRLEAVPPQKLDAAAAALSSPDWSALFSAAGLDMTQFKPTEPLWTWLATSDTRAAWLGKWPGSNRTLRVEGAALRGKPVAFALIGDWTKADRMADSSSGGGQTAVYVLLAFLAILTVGGSGLLARRNLSQARGDQRGALRLGVFMFVVLTAVWVCQVHLVGSMGTVAMFLMLVVTAGFYGLFLWTLYLALEPFVRRYWPQAMISWTTLLSGRLRDAIVGRDVLIGLALGIGVTLTGHLVEFFRLQQGSAPQLNALDLLSGGRATLGVLFATLPYSVRNALFFFFLLFVFRVLFRNQWIGAAAWLGLFEILAALGNRGHVLLALGAVTIIFGLFALVVLRWGLLSLTVGIFVQLLLYNLPASYHPEAWYFGDVVFLIAVLGGITIWAFYTSLGGQRLWKASLFE